MTNPGFTPPPPMPEGASASDMERMRELQQAWSRIKPGLVQADMAVLDGVPAEPARPQQPAWPGIVVPAVLALALSVPAALWLEGLWFWLLMVPACILAALSCLVAVQHARGRL